MLDHLLLWNDDGKLAHNLVLGHRDEASTNNINTIAVDSDQPYENRFLPSSKLYH